MEFINDLRSIIFFQMILPTDFDFKNAGMKEITIFYPIFLYLPITSLIFFFLNVFNLIFLSNLPYDIRPIVIILIYHLHFDSLIGC